MFFSCVAFGQDKTGYIVYDTVCKAHPDYAQMQKRLDLRYKQLEDTLVILQKKVNDFLNSTHNSPRWTESERKALQDSLTSLERKIQEYQVYAQDVIMAMAEKENAAMSSKIASEVRIFSALNNVMLGYIEDILYCESCLDYTDEFVKYLAQKR